MKHILIVDDSKPSLLSAQYALRSLYQVTAVSSGAEALEFLKTNICDAILLDINMPQMDGFEVFDKIREDIRLVNIPVVFLTADNDPITENRCFEKGADDFIAKPFVAAVMRSRIGRILELTDLKNNLSARLDEQTRHIRYIQEVMVLGLATMVESRDNGTGSHIRRTSDVVLVFAQKLLKNNTGMTKEFLRNVIRAAPMHDLGKIAVDDVILRKQGKFTDEEYAVMKKHSAEGARIVRDILEDVEEPAFVETAVNVAHFHHEKWNGTGYPMGLAGENIPVEARIMALADVLDALISKRCYKDAYSYDQAFGVIEDSLGSHFDPKLGQLFLSCRPELEELYDNFLKDDNGLHMKGEHKSDKLSELRAAFLS